ncbi:lipoprotein [Streptomyces sp. NPDC059783]|uniref:lipoprotein n=1 Tax=Streptomyces sp. NPDC059783 TaxID=3346944 RepID=UPI003653B612
MTGRTVRGLAPVLLAALALTGCSSGTDDGGGTGAEGKPSTAPATTTAAPAAKAGGAVGAAGSGCELPVVFDLAEHWKPKAVAPVEADDPLAALSTQGPVHMVCEIDAKPAGHIGFLRVWQGRAGASATPRSVLEGFVKADENASKVAYREVTSGKTAVTEVTYTLHSEVMDESRPARAFAVATPNGPVVVHLGGLDATEHRGMLPAYELARGSVRLG